MQQKANWWLLYAIVPLSIGLLWLDGRLSLQPRGHELLEMGIVLASFGLMAMWVRANQRAIAQDSCRHIVYSLPADQNRDDKLNWAQDRYNNPHANIGKRGSVGLGRYN